MCQHCLCECQAFCECIPKSCVRTRTYTFQDWYRPNECHSPLQKQATRTCRHSLVRMRFAAFRSASGMPGSSDSSWKRLVRMYLLLMFLGPWTRNGSSRESTTSAGESEMFSFQYSLNALYQRLCDMSNSIMDMSNDVSHIGSSLLRYPPKTAPQIVIGSMTRIRSQSMSGRWLENGCRLQTVGDAQEKKTLEKKTWKRYINPFTD